MIDTDLIARARALSCTDLIRPHWTAKQFRALAGPCPKCGGTDRFGISRRKNLWNCRGCQRGGDAIALAQLIHDADFPTAVEILTGERGKDCPIAGTIRSPTRQSEPDSDAEQLRKARFFWSCRLPIVDGSPAFRYLREARHHDGPFPPTLGYLPPLKSHHHPALIAAFGIPDEPEPGVITMRDEAVGAVHLTLLKPDGSGKADVKPDKIMIGPVTGNPIVLAPMNDLLGLAITEGIEDALSIHQATGLGAWAAGSAPHMAKLAAVVPEWTDSITICVDNNGAGRQNADELARGLKARGIHVEPIIFRGAK